VSVLSRLLPLPSARGMPPCQGGPPELGLAWRPTEWKRPGSFRRPQAGAREQKKSGDTASGRAAAGPGWPVPGWAWGCERPYLREDTGHVPASASECTPLRLTTGKPVTVPLAVPRVYQP
jgi:hypothetical protein